MSARELSLGELLAPSPIETAKTPTSGSPRRRRCPPGITGRTTSPLGTSRTSSGLAAGSVGTSPRPTACVYMAGKAESVNGQVRAGVFDARATVGARPRSKAAPDLSLPHSHVGQRSPSLDRQCASPSGKQHWRLTSYRNSQVKRFVRFRTPG